MAEKLEAGDKVVDIKTEERGVVSRLCADESVVHVKWSGGMQQMVDVSSLRKA